MGIKFASLVCSVEANARLIHETSDLNIPRGFHKLNGSESSRGHDASTMTRLGAVGYDNGFNVADLAIWGRGTPKTEVVD